MLNLNILPNLLVGRAGNRPRSGKPTMIAIHGQEGIGNPHSYFANVAADSTCWIARDGHIERYLLDSDIAWTEGDVTEPMAHTNPIIEGYLKAGITNFNEICLSVELEGWNSIQSATAHNNDQTYAYRTDAQYHAVVALCVYWCKTWGIPADRDHIVPHRDIGPHKGCPGSMIDVDQLAKDVAAQYTATKTPTPPAPLPPISVTNPKGLGVGGGVLIAMAAHNDTVQSDELYFVPKPNQRTDVTLCSLTWGAAYLYVSTPNPDGTWRVRTLKEI